MPTICFTTNPENSARVAAHVGKKMRLERNATADEIKEYVVALLISDVQASEQAEKHGAVTGPDPLDAT